MPAYMVVQINVTDPEKFARYREAVPSRCRVIGRPLDRTRRHCGGIGRNP